jgi:hypothetical protein
MAGDGNDWCGKIKFFFKNITCSFYYCEFEKCLFAMLGALI